MSGKPTDVPMAAQDANETERLKRELERLEARFHSLFVDGPDAVVVADRLGIARLVNPAAEALFETPAGGLVGRGLGLPIVDGRDREVEVVSGRGRRIACDMRVARTSWDGAPAYVATLSELTGHRPAADAPAERPDRGTTRRLAEISHELRTPVNAILGFAELMHSERLAPVEREKLVEYSRHIHTAGTHLLNLLNDFLALSKAESGALELNETEFDVARTIAKAVEAVAGSALRARLSLRIDDVAPTVLCADEVKITQILLNLLSNAIKFTPEHGEVSIRERLGRDGACVIEVADTGIGIPRHEIPRAFMPFAQVRAAANGAQVGTGLGLALTKQLVERHDGSIALISVVGSGTTARVTLPPSRVRAPAGRPLLLAAG